MSGTCPNEDELIGFLDRGLPPERLEYIERHVSSCTRCAAEVAELRTLISDIAAPVDDDSAPALDTEQHVVDVLGRLDQPPRRTGNSRGWLWGMAAAAAALVVVPVALRDGQTGDPASTTPRASSPKGLTGSEPHVGQWVPRGGPSESTLSRDVGVQVYTLRDGLAPLGAGSELPANAPLTAGLRNLGKAPAYVLLFGIDSRNDVHWISPAYTDPRTDPVSTLIAPSAQEQLLGDAVVFDDLPAGPLRIVALISSAPKRVSDVELLGGKELSADQLVLHFPNAEIRQLAVSVDH